MIPSSNWPSRSRRGCGAVSGRAWRSTRRCPERADDIRELFPALVEMEQLKPGVPVAAGALEQPAARKARPLARDPHIPSG